MSALIRRIVTSGDAGHYVAVSVKRADEFDDLSIDFRLFEHNLTFD